ncbi:hypothetical protein BO71DRAFT_28044 [Aspergillus ellipticus CBS 707.79]|uniref:C2H2-type domain-containing protein n=1 Tax=Aspergillus ellipticus CBS 707.79 TaxID=1448320 RepID=A0A319DVX8_9EURO|nr:hypothetical protein BO71DRAFT_28044 [Aspergillus ellipticus CBS 707.79]
MCDESSPSFQSAQLNQSNILVPVIFLASNIIMSPQSSLKNQTTSPDQSSETRRFKCSICQRKFNRREHLQRHESTHYSQKPFHCTLCRYSCRRRDLLTRHFKLSHAKKSSDDGIEAGASLNGVQLYSNSEPNNLDITG